MSKPKPVPLDHLRGNKKPVVRYTDILVEADVAEIITRAQNEFEAAEDIARLRKSDLGAQVRRDEAKAELERLQNEAVENHQVVRFSFRAIGRKAFVTLKEEHPPTPEQQKKAREEGLAIGLDPEQTRLSWDADKFPPALIAAASLEPKITPDEAWELFRQRGLERRGAHFALPRALAAQQGRDSADLGKSRSGSNNDPQLTKRRAGVLPARSYPALRLHRVGRHGPVQGHCLTSAGWQTTAPTARPSDRTGWMRRARS